jgi:hypothetical protein
VLFDKLSSDYGDKILFVKQIVYSGKEWKFYAKSKLQHSVFFYNQVKCVYVTCIILNSGMESTVFKKKSF